jgi:hypothetical protein
MAKLDEMVRTTTTHAMAKAMHRQDESLWSTPNIGQREPNEVPEGVPGGFGDRR